MCKVPSNTVICDLLILIQQGNSYLPFKGTKVACHTQGWSGRVPHLSDEQLQDDGSDVGSQGAGIAGLEPLLLHEQRVAGQACAAQHHTVQQPWGGLCKAAIPAQLQY